jgi:hypothetical protein
MSGQEQSKFEGAERADEAEVEGHSVVRGPEAEKLLQHSDETDEGPDVEGHLSLRNGPEKSMGPEGMRGPDQG